MSERATRTICPYCGVGCGLIATTNAEGRVSVAGDPEHPANFGRLCSKGAALSETLSLDDRLLHPEIDGRRASWDEALSLVATAFRTALDEYGPASVAIYGSGQLLTEDYYVANKLMKGFIGSANLDTNSRLCMASSVAGHKRAFGSDTVPGTYEDLELADLVVLVGSNLAWCHPVLYQRLAAAREKRGTRVIVIDPRRTATCEIADLHLALRPGTDVALFNGLLQHIASEGAIDRAFVWHHTSGLLGALKAAQSLGVREISGITGLARSDITAFFALFAATERVVTVYSQGVNQSSAGTDKVNAILNCHLATGRIGKPGMGPFSVTGQPNAMGGREVGGLANMLAAHMELDNPEHRTLVAKFWNTPNVAAKPGLKAVDLFHAVGDGRIRALWVLATNPVVSLPEADAVRRALDACPFVVVSDAIRETDTTRHADVLLPSLAWGEKSGTVTNSERRISRQRAFLPAPGEARADWWQLAEIGKRMGWREAFSYTSPADIFAEHARLSGESNDGARDFDISALVPETPDAYEAMSPAQWPQSKRPDAGADSKPGTRQRFFADGRFYTHDRRGRFVPTPFREPASAATSDTPLILNTGRIRDQWHTMTRTGKAARLMAQFAEPFVEIHPRDAAKLNLAPADIARVSSAHGEALLRVLVTERGGEGTIFAPMHWTGETASRARIGSIIAPHRDAVSGQPELKHTPVRVSRFPATWYGFALTRVKPDPQALHAATYWAVARTTGGWRLELAGEMSMTDGEAETLLRSLSRLAPTTEIIGYIDGARGLTRFAAFDQDRLAGLLFIASTPVAAERDMLARALVQPIAQRAERYRLLAGRAGNAAPEPGPIVCACMSVGRDQIRAALANGAHDVATVGAMTGAGTSCGSCRAEIGGLLHAAARQKAS